MRYKKEDEEKEIKLDESVVSQFRRYLSELHTLRSLASKETLCWWDN